MIRRIVWESDKQVFLKWKWKISLKGKIVNLRKSFSLAGCLAFGKYFPNQIYSILRRFCDAYEKLECRKWEKSLFSPKLLKRKFIKFPHYHKFSHFSLFTFLHAACILDFGEKFQCVSIAINFPTKQKEFSIGFHFPSNSCYMKLFHRQFFICSSKASTDGREWGTEKNWLWTGKKRKRKKFFWENDENSLVCCISLIYIFIYLFLFIMTTNSKWKTENSKDNLSWCVQQPILIT